MNGFSRFFKPLLYIYIFLEHIYSVLICCFKSLVVINIQFFVNNRIIQLLVANRLLINYLSIYLSILLGKNSARKCIFHSVKNRPKIPIFSTFINNEILRNFEGKNHRLVQRILEEVYYTSVKPYCCSTTYEKSRLGN